MSRLVYLCGKSRAGKDEFARLWIKHNPSFIRLAFADAIKEVSARILGVKLEDLSNPETKEKYRSYLIFGGQLVRSIDPDYWVKQVTTDKRFKTQDIIITDVRFENEVNELDFRGQYYNKDVTSIRIEATEENRIARGANPAFFNDMSETDLDKFTYSDYSYTVQNNGTLQDLEDSVRGISGISKKV